MNIGACRRGFTGLPFPFVSCAGLNCAEGGRSALTDPLCCHPPSLWRQRCHCCPNGAGNPNTRTESICSGSAGPLLCIERTELSPSVQERPVGWHPPCRPVLSHNSCDRATTDKRAITRGRQTDLGWGAPGAPPLAPGSKHGRLHTTQLSRAFLWGTWLCLCARVSIWHMLLLQPGLVAAMTSPVLPHMARNIAARRRTIALCHNLSRGGGIYADAAPGQRAATFSPAACRHCAAADAPEKAGGQPLCHCPPV